MNQKRLLLISNSKSKEGYLAHAIEAIKDFLGTEIEKLLFIPFAGVSMSFDEYLSLVREHFNEMGYELESIHKCLNPEHSIRKAEAIVVGGGNTFYLVHDLYKRGIINAIRKKVNEGTPYIGWSAGSNIACPTIKTTNDMPIIEPPSFNALALIPFQINPHYLDFHSSEHHGETRSERITEFTRVNPELYVVGLREGSILRIEGDSIKLIGKQNAKIFKMGQDPTEYTPEDSLSFLLSQERKNKENIINFN